VDLSGPWGALIADDDLRRTWLAEASSTGIANPAGATPPDHAWEPIQVPGHWRSHAAFADTDGPLLYRTRFDGAAHASEHNPEHASEHADGPRRHWLVLDGTFYQGDVWLDGSYLGDTEGYFFPHTFEITEPLTARSEHLLGVEVACARPTDRTAKRNITGVFQHWNCLDPDWNPGGLWRPVWLEDTGPVRIRGLRAVCREASAERAIVVFTAKLDTVGATSVELCTTIDSIDHQHRQPLAAGTNQVTWTVTVPEPRLWWPHALGDQPMYDVVVEARLHRLGGHAGGPGADEAPHQQVSHRVTRRIGLRQVALRNWVLHVNGERMFVKGSNHGPTRMALGDATPDELSADVDLAKEAGLDLLRIHAHITRPELYDAADDAGLLLWQDFPLQWGYSRGIKGQAVRQATKAVDELAQHPSVVLWCAHNEPLALDLHPGDAMQPTFLRKYLVGQELPTWNKTVLDRAVKRAIEKADGSRPAIAHSGVLPHPPKLDGTASHFYFGWYHGHERDFPALARAVPRLVRFVSEFGAQAVPVDADFMDPHRWPALDWERLAHTHALQKSVFDQHVPPAEHATFDGWRTATQAYQATVIKHHIETLRRLKYRPTGGFAQFCFADGHPAVTWSVLGHDRAPKAGYDALKAACAPVIVVADRPPATLAPGTPLALDVHVVSDLRQPLEQGVVTARVTWNGGEHSWHWGGDIPADSCIRIGTLQLVVPDARGSLVVDVALNAVGHTPTNRYESTITPQ